MRFSILVFSLINIQNQCLHGVVDVSLDLEEDVELWSDIDITAHIAYRKQYNTLPSPLVLWYYQNSTNHAIQQITNTYTAPKRPEKGVKYAYQSTARLAFQEEPRFLREPVKIKVVVKENHETTEVSSKGSIIFPTPWIISASYFADSMMSRKVRCEGSNSSNIIKWIMIHGNITSRFNVYLDQCTLSNKLEQLKIATCFQNKTQSSFTVTLSIYSNASNSMNNSLWRCRDFNDISKGSKYVSATLKGDCLQDIVVVITAECKWNSGKTTMLFTLLQRAIIWREFLNKLHQTSSPKFAKTDFLFYMDDGQSLDIIIPFFSEPKVVLSGILVKKKQNIGYSHVCIEKYSLQDHDIALLFHGRRLILKGQAFKWMIKNSSENYEGRYLLYTENPVLLRSNVPFEIRIREKNAQEQYDYLSPPFTYIYFGCLSLILVIIVVVVVYKLSKRRGQRDLGSISKTIGEMVQDTELDKSDAENSNENGENTLYQRAEPEAPEPLQFSLLAEADFEEEGSTRNSESTNESETNENGNIRDSDSYEKIDVENLEDDYTRLPNDNTT